MSLFKSWDVPDFMSSVSQESTSEKRRTWTPAQRFEPIPRRENLVRYIVRASFSQDRMNYLPDKAKVALPIQGQPPRKSFWCLWAAFLVQMVILSFWNDLLCGLVGVHRHRGPKEIGGIRQKMTLPTHPLVLSSVPDPRWKKRPLVKNGLQDPVFAPGSPYQGDIKVIHTSPFPLRLFFQNNLFVKPLSPF